jgi:hypothetical protein
VVSEAPNEAGDSVTVTISDQETVANNLLRFWLVANVLKESLPNPMMTIPASYHKVLIWNNRVEAYSRIMRWKLQDTILMEEVDSVVTDKRLVTVKARDGREISIKALVREDAKKAEAIIEERVAVHRAPPIAELR